MADSGDKRHPATANRLRRLREEGQVAMSRELAPAALLAVLAVLWPAAIRPFGQRLIDLAREAWQPERIASPDPLHAMNQQMTQAAQTTGLIVGMVLLAIFCVAGLVDFLQVGPLFTMKRLFSVDRLNPAKGFQNIFFSGDTYQKAALGLVKAAAMLALAGACVWAALPNLILSMRLGPMATVRVFDGAFTLFLWAASAAYALFAGADYLIQRQSFAKKNRMTDEELKQDQKDSEGNLEMRMHLRQLEAMALHQRRQQKAMAAPRKKPRVPRTFDELLNGPKR